MADEAAQPGQGFEAVARYLDEQGVSYETIEHERTESAAAEARATGVPPEDAAKVVLLRDAERYMLAVLPASERLDVRKVRELLGADTHPRLATEEEMAADFGAFEVGALPPFGPMLPAPELVDRRLLDHDRIVCTGGDHLHSVRLDPNEIIRLADPTVGDLCQD